MKKNQALVGRKREIERLEEMRNSDKSEFLAVFGRRRVGKTFLIREFFNYQFDFHISGLAEANTKQQLFNFDVTLAKSTDDTALSPSENWLRAFQRLENYLEKKEGGRKKVVFIDELPWFDTKGSDFLMGLEHFWNSWASNRKDILLIVCGSAASWMINKLINNKGGLHNRVTQKIRLNQFTLAETEEMLNARGCVLDKYQIMQLYMCMGGVPYYLEAVKKDFSAAQNIQNLFFNRDSVLRNEFGNLYRSLFKNHEIHEKLVEALANKNYGLTRKELVEISGMKSGGTLTKLLAELEESGFITQYHGLGGKQKDILYRLSDFYTHFYFKFIKGYQFVGDYTWLSFIDNPKHRAWQGFVFEQVCLQHIDQIKRALGINGIQSSHLAWKGGKNGKHAQIDLLIDRRDQVINIGECKFSISKFAIDKDYAEKIANKIAIFKEASQTPKAVFFTMITTYGVERNQYYHSLVQNEVTMEDLFRQS